MVGCDTTPWKSCENIHLYYSILTTFSSDVVKMCRENMLWKGHENVKVSGHWIFKRSWKCVVKLSWKYIQLLKIPWWKSREKLFISHDVVKIAWWKWRELLWICHETSWKCLAKVVNAFSQQNMKKSSQLFTNIGEYLQLTPVIKLKMYYFVARHCQLFILYYMMFLLINLLQQLMAYILLKTF